MAKKFKGSTPIQRQYYNARERYNAARRKYKKQGAVFNENLFQPQSVTALAKRGASDQEFLQRIEAIEANLRRLTEPGMPDLSAIGIQGMVDLATGEYIEYDPSPYSPNRYRIGELPYIQKQVEINKKQYKKKLKQEMERQERLQRERIQKQLDLEYEEERERQRYEQEQEDFFRNRQIDQMEKEVASISPDETAELEDNVYSDDEYYSGESLDDRYLYEEDEYDKKYYEDADQFYTKEEKQIYDEYLDQFSENWFRDGDYIVHKKTGVRIPIEDFDSTKIPTENKTILKNVLYNLGGAAQSTQSIVDASGSSFDDSALNDIQNKLDTWDADPSWSYDLAQTKERDKNRAASILQGAIERDGYDAVARRLKENADTIGDIIDNILYKTSGGTRDVYDNARDNVEENFVEFANIVNGRILSLDENERITEIYDEMNLYD